MEEEQRARPGGGEPSYVAQVSRLDRALPPECQQEHYKHHGAADRQSGQVEHEARNEEVEKCRTPFVVNDWHRQAHGVTHDARSPVREYQALRLSYVEGNDVGVVVRRALKMGFGSRPGVCSLQLALRGSTT